MLSQQIAASNNRSIRIAAFGHRGVGKSTYLTALYAILVNNTYRGVDFEYTDDDTAAKLAEYLNAVAENYSSTKDWQLPPTVSMPQELHFLLKRKGQEYHLNLIDYRGESTTIGEMTQNKELLDFFATCDGLMIFNANDADEEDRTARRASHLARHQDLKYLFSSLKNRSGKSKLQIPVAMVYTKSDKIDFGTLSPEDWVEDNNSALMETLKNNVQVYRTMFLSSQMAFLNVMDNDRFRLTETERSGNVVKCDTDVAYPLFWLLNQIQPPHQEEPLTPSTEKKPSSKWLAITGIIAIILFGGYFGYKGFISNDKNVFGKYPEASTRILTMSDLQSIDKSELRLMRNEIFARHGYIFKAGELKDYFSQQDWYVGKYVDCNHMLTDIEKENIKTIQACEKKTDLPFIGRRNFEMYPEISGTGTTHFYVEIKEDGETVFGSFQENKGNGAVTEQTFSAGKFQKIIPCEICDDEYYTITKDKIFVVNKKGDIRMNCCDMDSNEDKCPCESELYQ